ncbi:MAG: helix-turn-helix domain-containing protein [Leptolyngbyaceae cyanobacterium T60_A2020_046]|nr:helix-turn-helix domain-containing protein [Leptolyngbyaceae cyanobacterium T60_A2020_046]
MKRQLPDIHQLHREQLVGIGQILRDARESHGLTCDDLAEKTLIRANLLSAIEAAQVEQLPEPVYTRGLIRRYANTLGLDGETLSSQYFTPPSRAVERSFWRVPVTPQLRPLHLYVAYVLLIAVAVSGLSYTLKRAGYRTSTLPVLEGEALEEAILPDESEDPEESAAVAPALPPEVADSAVRVEVQMQDQSWLRITADGQVAFEGILREGESRLWAADKELKVRAGNAGGVSVSFNGGNAEVLGQPGAVAEVTYPPATEQASLASPTTRPQ